MVFSIAPGTHYFLSLSTGTWTEPPGVGALMSTFFEAYWLLGIDFDGVDVRAQLGLAEVSGGQDFCVTTPDALVAPFTGPPSILLSRDGPGDFSEGADLPTVPNEMVLNLSTDGTLASVDMGFLLDMRLTSFADEAGLEPDVCSLLPGFGIECEACPVDGEAYCLVIRIEDIPPTPSAETIVAIEDDICHPDCATCE